MSIAHISDTARWVAFYRAMESERPDAIFRDPFARRLAGPEGETIVRTMKRGRAMAWPMIVRTQVFDEILLSLLGDHQVDLVVNLAAGLDARPWRLALPDTLRWVDVDLPDILDYKLDALTGHTTSCRYEALRTDLTDADARHDVLARLGASAARAVILTEGLLIYLTPDQVGSLAAALHAQPSFQYWVIDLASPRLLKMMSGTWGKAVAAGNAPFQFAPAESTEFFAPFGWREDAFHSTFDAGLRLKRTMRGAWFWSALGKLSSSKKQEEFRRFAGIALLARR